MSSRRLRPRDQQQRDETKTPGPSRRGTNQPGREDFRPVARIPHIRMLQLGAGQERTAISRVRMRSCRHACHRRPGRTFGRGKEQRDHQGRPQRNTSSTRATAPKRSKTRWSKRMGGSKEGRFPSQNQYRYRRGRWRSLVRMYSRPTTRNKAAVPPRLPDGAVRVFRDNGAAALLRASQNRPVIPHGDKIELNLAWTRTCCSI